MSAVCSLNLVTGQVFVGACSIGFSAISITKVPILLHCFCRSNITVCKESCTLPWILLIKFYDVLMFQYNNTVLSTTYEVCETFPTHAVCSNYKVHSVRHSLVIQVFTKAMIITSAGSSLNRL